MATLKTRVAMGWLRDLKEKAPEGSRRLEQPSDPWEQSTERGGIVESRKVARITPPPVVGFTLSKKIR